MAASTSHAIRSREGMMTNRWIEKRPGRWERDGVVVRKLRPSATVPGRVGWRAHFANGMYSPVLPTAEEAMAYADEHEARVMAPPVDDSGPYTNPVVDSERPVSDTQTAKDQCERALGAQDGLVLKSDPKFTREYADDAREVLNGGGRPGRMALACLDLETLQDALASAQRERHALRTIISRCADAIGHAHALLNGGSDGR